MIVVAVVAAVFLAAAAGMALVRIVRGPSTLDRIVATDVLLAITVCAIATEAAYSRDTTGLPILLGLSLLGTTGSVAVARFADPAARRAAGVPSSASAGQAGTSAGALGNPASDQPPAMPETTGRPAAMPGNTTSPLRQPAGASYDATSAAGQPVGASHDATSTAGQPPASGVLGAASAHRDLP